MFRVTASLASLAVLGMLAAASPAAADCRDKSSPDCKSQAWKNRADASAKAKSSVELDNRNTNTNVLDNTNQNTNENTASSSSSSDASATASPTFNFSMPGQDGAQTAEVPSTDNSLTQSNEAQINQSPSGDIKALPHSSVTNNYSAGISQSNEGSLDSATGTK